MSEQTPTSSDNISGAEPSMEDILASIRKIISDDEPVAMESPEDAPAVDLVETAPSAGLDDMMPGIHMDSNDLTSDAVLDAAIVQPETFAGDTDVDTESVDLNIDDVLASLDEDILEDESDDLAFGDSELSSILDGEDTDSADLDTQQLTQEIEGPTEIAPDVDDDILSFLDADIPLDDELSLETTKAAPAMAAATASVAGLALGKGVLDDDLEIDALLDDILMSPVDDIEVGDADETDAEYDFDEAYDDDTIETDDAADTTSAEVSDLELVKSLMADLADDSSDPETDEDLDALLAIPEAPEETDFDGALANYEVDGGDVGASEDDAPEAEFTADQTEAEEDILGDILDMTLDDELQSHPDDIDPNDIDLDDLTSLDAVLDAEQENLADSIDFDDALPTDDTTADDLPSLSEIAAAAEADAIAVETIQAPQAVAAAVGGAALGAVALGATSAETDVETEVETAETYSEPTPEPISTIEETSMPVKAVKTDAILDEVTETAAAGAFAELNQVVEDKAVFNESGPRIGDLVQDALRPMLKEWLDANLKGIVERAVTKEVKRISSGK